MNTPTKLTVLRLLMVPFFMHFLSVNTHRARMIALAIFIIASLTDFIDGYLARKYDQITDLGKFLDPLADKVLVAAAFILLVELGELRAWGVIIIVAREFFVSVMRAVLAAKGIVVAAGKWGKAKTIVQMLAIILLLAAEPIAVYVQIPLGLVLFYVSVVLTLISGFEYYYYNRKGLFDEKTG